QPPRAAKSARGTPMDWDSRGLPTQNSLANLGARGVLAVNQTPQLKGRRLSPNISHVEVAHVERILFDELPARLDLVAHQHAEELVGAHRIVDSDAEQSPRVRAHRGLPELVGVHLAEALVARDRHAFARP